MFIPIKNIDTRVFVFLTIMFLNLIGSDLNAQKVYLPEIDTSGDIYFYHFDKSKAYSNHQGRDTVKMLIQLPEHHEEISLFPGNAEINILELKDTTIYSGKYMDKTKVYNPNDNYFLVIPPNHNSQIVELTSYNLSSLDFYMAPYITTHKSVEFHITKFVIEGQLGIVIAVGFLGGSFVLILFFTFSYLSDRKAKDHYFFILYLLTILIFNSIQMDSFLRFYILFPKNPIIYHQIFDFSSLSTYVVYILVVIKFLELDKSNPKLSRRTKFFASIILIGSLITLTAGIMKEFKIIQEGFIWIYIASFIAGSIIICDIAYHVRTKFTYLSLYGSIFLLIGVMFEFVTSRIFEDSYYWNLERPLLGHIFPVNFTHFGNWFHLIFFSMIIGFKYKKTDISTQEMHQSNLEDLKRSSEIERLKMEQLANTFSEQENHLKQRNQVFDFLQTKVGTIKQQLNPKFINNMLTAITPNIEVKDKETAKKQIGLIKEFLNQIISSSESELVPLIDDLNILNAFVELEKIRHYQRLKLNINLSLTEDEFEYLIPPFLFQEYVENIVWDFSTSSYSNHVELNTNINSEFAEIRITEFSEESFSKNEVKDSIITRIRERLDNSHDSIYSLDYVEKNNNQQHTLILRIIKRK